VFALAVLDGKLYAGGNFTNTAIGPSPVYRWDGVHWASLGTSRTNFVYALATSGGKLYAAGGGDTISNTFPVSQWDGIDWSTIGTPLDAEVVALAVSGNTLYAGGAFWGPVTNRLFGIARISIAGPVPVVIITSNNAFGLRNGLFGFDVSGPPGSNVVIQAGTDLRAWTPLQTNALNGNGLFYFSDPQSPTGGRRFYRAVEQ
jgi:hypothetical protein